MKRVLCLLLSISLLLYGCTPAERVGRSYLRADHGHHQRHGLITYDDMVLDYSDPAEVIKALDLALNTIDASADPDEYISIYEEQVQAYNDLVSAASLAYVRYCENVEDIPWLVT